MRGKLEFLAGLEIEPVDQAGDGARRARMQRFGECPERFIAMRRLGQKKTRRIEAERFKAVAGQAAMAALSIGRSDKDEGAGAGQASQNRREETEGGGSRAFRVGHDFMQAAARQAAVREMGIDRRKIERQHRAGGGGPGLLAAQQMA